ncbi:capsule assembly Wzi family protein [Thalassotalea fonticola]|uniref:Capsule assembly Wzi family protein n=1 Tax=Thalassotalea fonticola TaxID=3065649 RepID=A0ABZ0GV85_9GAMM|nr:capsule assembly Wzi family protein [Colwelliaceae bacterium S1-1]
MKYPEKKFTLPLSLLFISLNSFAEPWIDTSNIFLRADLQLLSDKGHINTTTTTYPIMWAEVSRALKSVDETSLDETSKNAYWHIKQHLRRANNNQHKIELNFATKDKRFTSFGDEYRDDNVAKGGFSFIGDAWSAKLSASIVDTPEDGEEARIDGSYIATHIGNWVLSAGAYDRWWGPGWDSNLALTNNARPLAGVAISRKTSEPFVMPFFNDIKIPWTVTTFMNVFEEDRHVPNTWLWGFRLNFKPIPSLELGITRLAQWNGDNRPGGFDTFMDVLAGKDNCELTAKECDDLDLEPGNQLAGADARYTANWFAQPFSIYTQMMAEDGNSKNGDLVGQKVWTYGADTQLFMFDTYWRAYLEYTDSYTDCTPRNSDDRLGVGDCLYEHHIYRSGMRYEGRAIGNLYDNDSETYVLGFVSQLTNLSSWEIKLKYLDLNYDNSDWYPDDPNLGNTVTKVAEEVYMLSIKYQLRQGRFKYTVGGDYSKSSYINEDLKDSSEPNMYFNVEYIL